MAITTDNTFDRYKNKKTSELYTQIIEVFNYQENYLNGLSQQHLWDLCSLCLLYTSLSYKSWSERYLLTSANCTFDLVLYGRMYNAPAWLFFLPYTIMPDFFYGREKYEGSVPVIWWKKKSECRVCLFCSAGGFLFFCWVTKRTVSHASADALG